MDDKFKAGCLVAVFAYLGAVAFSVIVLIARGDDVRDDDPGAVESWIPLALIGVVMLVAWFFTSRD